MDEDGKRIYHECLERRGGSGDLDGGMDRERIFRECFEGREGGGDLDGDG